MTPTQDLIHTLAELGTKWGKPPVLIPSCAGYTDEHLQIWHPDFHNMPCYVVFPDGRMEEHPDAPFDEIAESLKR